MKIAIVGAGVIGRTIAFLAQDNGFEIDIYEAKSVDNYHTASFTAAGMLSPYCEMEYADPILAQLGIKSLTLYKEFLSKLSKDVFFQAEGSIIVAHRLDKKELLHLEQVVSQHYQNVFKRLDKDELQQLEPELDFEEALFFPNEAQIRPKDYMLALDQYLAAQGINIQYNQEVDAQALQYSAKFDYIIDTRGLAAQQNLKLRSIRGEIIKVQADFVKIKRPVRLMHPRYPLYIVPRPHQEYIIGASSLETEDYSNISLRSSLELLGAAYCVHKGFDEARVLESKTHCRPAFEDNMPKIIKSDNILYVNGLFRHGFMLSPAIASYCIDILQQNPLNQLGTILFSEQEVSNECLC